MSDLKTLENLFNQGTISRREFLARASALGLTASVAPSLFSAEAMAEKPKKGGRFRAGISSFYTTDSLDPATLSDIGNYFINWQLRNNLVEVDHKGRAIPELAVSMDPSPDAVTWTFQLRKGVEFHNGKTMEAEDVVYSINHHRGEKSKSGAKALVKQIKEVKAKGKDAVVFTLTGGNADFPYIMSDYHLPIFPAGTTGEAFEKGIGTGAYVLKSWEPGVRVFATKNPNYWKKGRGHFDEVETLGIGDVNSRTNGLKTGELDWINRCDLKTIHLLKRMPGIQILRVTGTFHYLKTMMTDVAPYDSNDVRLAMKYAINRQEILDKVLRGYGTIGNDHPIAPIQRFHASDLPQRHYDPDKARFHLKKAGLEGQTFKLYTATHAGFLDHAVLFKEQAAKAGINIELVQRPADGYWSNVWLKEPFVSSHWNGRITTDWMLSAAYYGDAPWNASHFHNARFDNMLVEARAELNTDKRRDMYFECQKILRNQGGAIVYVFKDNVEAAVDTIRYDQLAGNWEGDGARAAERWWFA